MKTVATAICAVVLLGSLASAQLLRGHRRSSSPVTEAEKDEQTILPADPNSKSCKVVDDIAS